MKTMTLMSLNEAFAESVEQIGQKAARLAQLIHAGYPTPPGLIIPAELVSGFWGAGSCKVPQEFADQAWQLSTELFQCNVLVVRSTGIEDGHELSYAGQFASVTDVHSARELQEALITCIASSRSERIDRYSEVSGVQGAGSGSFAVLIMPQRECLCAGILFSTTKLGDDTDEYVAVQVAAQSNFGLTSGTETGDVIYLDRLTGNLRWSIPDQLTVPTCTLDVLRELHRLALELEGFMGFPIDLEWGVLQDGTVEVFQVRPITAAGQGSTTANLRIQIMARTSAMMRRSLGDLKQRAADVESNFWSDQNIAELITEHPSRMAFGIFTYIFAHGEGAIRMARNEMGYEIGGELQDGFFELVGGQPRCSIVHDALTYRVKGIPLDDYVAGFVIQYLERIKTNSQLANYPEVVLYNQNPSRQTLEELFGRTKGEEYAKHYSRFFQGLGSLEDEVIDQFNLGFVPTFETYVQSKRQSLQCLGSFTLPALVDQAYSILEHLRTESCRMFVKVARLGFFGYARLKHSLEAVFGEDEGRRYLDGITASLGDDSALRFNVRLKQLREGKIEIDTLVDEYGHLGPHEMEIANPRYRDQVTLLQRLAEDLQGDPETDLAARSKAALTLVEEVEHSFPQDKLEQLRRDIEVTRNYLSMRERAKYYFLMEYDLLRQVLVEAARRIGVSEELIFELDPHELPMLVSDPSAVSAMLRERYEERHLIETVSVPAVLSPDNLAEIGQQQYDLSAKVMMGIGITPIVMTGKVVVVLDPNDNQAAAELEPGCVLVTRTTDPTWAPIISAVGGNGALVTEIGGPLAHGAIVARQLGIACVQNVAGATKRFKTGDTVQVDGRHGTVTLVKEA
ncbi:MAG: PEP-utilizing enzyme [bacterium]|nr:PEP-utilizing enzyme [bacterium]